MRVKLAYFFAGSHMFLLRYWGSKNGPFLQGLHLMYAVAAIISPQVAQPFLMPRPVYPDNVTNTSDAGNAFLMRSTSEVNGSFSTSSMLLNAGSSSNVTESMEVISTPSVILFYNSNYSNESTIASQTMKSRLYYVYVINASFLLLLAIISFIPFCYEPHISRSRQMENLLENEKPKMKKRVFEKFVWFIFCVSNLCLGSLEVSYSGLLLTFVVEHLNWSKSNGTLLLTISASCYAFARLVGILASSFVKPSVILGVDYVIVLASLFCLTVLVHVHPAVVWVCCSLMPLGVATIFASNLTWTRDFFHVSGVFTSFYMSGYSIGSLGGPALIGYLYKHLHALWYFYMLIIFAGTLSFLYTVLLLLSCFINYSHTHKEPELNIVEMRGMLDPVPLENNIATK